MNVLSVVNWPKWDGMLEILVLAVALYYVMLFFHGTRGASVLSGFVLALFALLIITEVFTLATLNWIISRLSVYLAIAFVIIFQPEVRRALAQLGTQRMFASPKDRQDLVEQVVKAVHLLAAQKIGALIALERDIGLRGIQETGVRLDSQLSAELLATLFFPHTPLHDGGAILRENRIAAAGCVFPLSQRSEISRSLGTRHRAAIGLSEESDAVVVVVSEETGTISVAYRGRLIRGLDEQRLQRILTGILRRMARRSRLSRAQGELDLTPEGLARAEARSHNAEAGRGEGA
ncbi:MAG: diadenylate cyclase CdaA [Candidatus Marinimicrobia bacterium]|nr:diadenylate cyclase CdaA [Candidatus Neomarinimicrobiota bacterium]